MVRLAALVAALAALWLLLSGHYSPLLLVLGAISCGVTALICTRMNVVDRDSMPLQLLIHLPAYVVWLAGAVARANWDVIQRVVRPGSTISPTMIRLRAGQHSAIGQMIFANSITLTPGTVTVGLTGGELTVHALVDTGTDDMENGEMDRRVRRLEGGRPGHAS